MEVGTSEPRTCDAGANKFAFHCDALDTSGVKRSALNNVSALTATLVDAEGVDVTRVTCVTQVTKDDANGLIRRVISPLE